MCDSRQPLNGADSEPVYEAPYRKLLRESGASEEVQSIMTQAANREVNMVGGRFSDCVASQIDLFRRLGQEEYLAFEERITYDIRRMGY